MDKKQNFIEKLKQRWPLLIVGLLGYLVGSYVFKMLVN